MKRKQIEILRYLLTACCEREITALGRIFINNLIFKLENENN